MLPRSVEFFESILLLKKSVDRASNTEIGQEDVTSIWELQKITREVDFGTSILGMYCYSGDNK